jgi:hypothetical protein
MLAVLELLHHFELVVLFVVAICFFIFLPLPGVAMQQSAVPAALLQPHRRAAAPLPGLRKRRVWGLLAG